MSTGQYNLTPPVAIDGRSMELQVDSRGNLRAVLTAPGGTSTATIATLVGDNTASGSIGGVLYTASIGYLFNGTNFDRVTKANATARLLSAAASTNATSVKASAGNVHKIVGTQVNAAARYLKLYNKASAPTVGSDTPIWTFYLPPTAVGGGIFDLDFGDSPLYFSTGIAYALTTAAADADTGALTAGDVIAMNIAYS